MKDGYWNQQRQYHPPLSSTPHGGPLKRHRSDFEGTQYVMPLGDMHSYLSRDEDRGIPHSVKDTRTIGSVYDRYLQSVVQSLFTWSLLRFFFSSFFSGLPSNCSRREVSHIFRPFVGYREVKLVTKDSKHRSGDPIVLCFVDFENPACAATALSALQGYRMDEDESDSKILRLQFSRNPGPRPGQRGGRR